MSSPDPFWESMTRLRAWKDVAAGWRDHFGTAYGQAEPYFTLESETAFYYPCPAPCGMSCRMRVREHKMGFFAFCAEEYPQADPVDLEYRDVLVYRLNIDAVCRDVAAALGIGSHTRPEPVAVNAWEIGAVTLPPGRGIPVTLTLPLNTRDYTDVAKSLLSRGRAANILLVPDACDGETRRLIEDNAGRVLSLSKIAPGIPTRNATPVHSLASILSVSMAAPEPEYQFMRKTGSWIVRWAGGNTGQIPDTKGARYILILLEHPFVDYSALELQQLEGRVADAPELGQAIKVAGDMRIGEWRNELAVNQREYDRAEADGDKATMERLKTEHDELVQHIKESFGMGGRSRTVADAEKNAKDSVGKAIDVVHRNLAKEGLPEMSAYLRQTIRTGRTLIYHPPHTIHWNL